MVDRESLSSQFGQGLVPVLGVLHVTALVVAGFGLVHAALVVTWFAGSTSARGVAVIDQALLVTLWGIVTSVCLVLVAISIRWLSVAAVVWLSALLATTPWRWPGPPLSRSDASDVPIWLDGGMRPLLWANALFVVGFGVRLAWHRGQWRRAVAVVIGASAVALLVAANVRITLADREENPTPTADGAVSLADAEADELWSELPERPGQFDQPTAARLMAWGEEEPSKLIRTLPTNRTVTIFNDSVDAAERTGWEPEYVSSPESIQSYQRATFQKMLPTGPGRLTITTSPTNYVRVALVVQARSSSALR